MLRLNRPDHRVRVLAFQHPADARDRAACTDAAAEAVNRLARLLENFNGGVHQMRLRVCRVFKLPGYKDVRVLRSHLRCPLCAGTNTFADVAVVVDQNDLCTVVLHDLTALLADRVGHNDDCFVAAYRAHQRKADALIAAGRLYDDAVPVQQAGALGCKDHVVCRARLDRAADVDGLEFNENLRSIRTRHVIQTDERRAADSFKNIFANHSIPPRSSSLTVYAKTQTQANTSKKAACPQQVALMLVLPRRIELRTP